MKKHILTIGAACAAALAIYGASDRIDIFNKAGEFISIMVNNIQEITVGKSDSGNGFSTVNVVTPSGTRTRDIEDIDDIQYSPVIPDKAHEITITNAENAKIRLLDWRNNTDVYGVAQIDPTKPADWRGCWADGNPHFLVDTDKGYASEFQVIGAYTKTVYTDNPNFIFWSMKEFNLLGIDSYSFDMPYEPVEIKASSVELDTYADAPFLGTYKGYLLTPEKNRIAHKEASTLSVEFKANTTYVIKSTDAHNYDVLDLYTWNEENNTVAYVPYEGDMRNLVDIDVKDGLIGKFVDGGILYATMHNIIEDKPENSARYFAALNDGEVTVAASDDYNSHLLVQYVPADGSATRYFYYPIQTVYPEEVTMEWSYGNNIGADCTAFCVSNGEKIFKYDYTGSGTPKFTFRGAEYGTYTGAGDALSLDGFGKCTLGEQSGSYTIDGGLVTVTIGSNSLLFVIDRAAHTYSEMTSDKWDGQSHYSIENAAGSYRGGELNNLNSMTIDMDKDFGGKDAVGTASVRFNIKRTDGFSGDGGSIADDGSYIYNAATNTIIITNIFMGTSATNSGRTNLILKVSDDKLSMWVDDSTSDRIYGTGRDGSYLLAGTVNTLTAPAPAKTITLAPVYTGAPNMLAFGNAAPTETTLTIDADAKKATFFMKALGTTLVDSTVDYTLEGNTLTLVGVPTYPDQVAYGTPTPTDIVYTVSDDGTTLSSDQHFYAVAMGMCFEIDLSSDNLVGEVPAPVPAITLADKYTGAPNMLAFGNAAATETTLTVDADNSKATLLIKGMGTPIINSTVDYTLDGNKLTLVGVPTYPDQNPYGAAAPTDIVYTVSEDGTTLTADQHIYGAAMGMCFEIDLSSDNLTAE